MKSPISRQNFAKGSFRVIIIVEKGTIGVAPVASYAAASASPLSICSLEKTTGS